MSQHYQLNVKKQVNVMSKTSLYSVALISTLAPHPVVQCRFVTQEVPDSPHSFTWEKYGSGEFVTKLTKCRERRCFYT